MAGEVTGVGRAAAEYHADLRTPPVVAKDGEKKAESGSTVGEYRLDKSMPKHIPGLGQVRLGEDRRGNNSVTTDLPHIVVDDKEGDVTLITRFGKAIPMREDGHIGFSQMGVSTDVNIAPYDGSDILKFTFNLNEPILRITKRD